MSKPRNRPGGPRGIFEDVSAAPAQTRTEPQTRARASAPGAAEAARRRNRRAVAVWLLVLAAMVAAMVLVGGLTRLTDSGLSITEWRPVTGAWPPMSDAAWAAAFERYRAIPEYQLVKKGMTLAEFKGIYWWEWGHRQLGRSIGLVWALGFGWFFLRRRIPPGWTGRLLLAGGLGGLQGAIGWWMVASGLTGRMVDVASYRLAIHLVLAFGIFTLLLWFAWRLRRDEVTLIQARRRRLGGLATLAGALLALAFAQVALGGLVAGIDAGRGYVDWPLMGGEFLPSESFDYAPLWSNFFENPALVQFNHRMIGYLLALCGALVWLRGRAAGHAGAARWTAWAFAALAAQMTLGVVTVINAAPLGWSAVHQAGALVAVALILRARFEACFPAEQRIARG